MPKYIIQWKDPDFNIAWHGNIWALSEEEQRKLDKLGASEYISIIFDTDAMTATVKGE